jgi:hypothetical protein
MTTRQPRLRHFIRTPGCSFCAPLPDKKTHWSRAPGFIRKPLDSPGCNIQQAGLERLMKEHGFNNQQKMYQNF